MNNKNKAGAIIRVSTTRQLEGTSPEKQIERILALAGAQGYEIDQKHIWRLAESGGSRERVSFAEALKAGEKDEISRVYVFNIDRLGRNLLEMLLFLRQLDDLGIDCWGAEKGQQLKGDDFILQIEGAVASKERQEILKRTQDGLVRAIKAGKYSGGIVAYGYRVNHDTKELEIEPTEADVVRLMFKWCVEERMSTIKIAERLNAMNIPTRYKKNGITIHRRGKRAPEKTTGLWRGGRIGNMLRNPAYMGKWEWGKRSKKRKPGDTIPGYCPEIVSEETFAKAAEVLKQNRLFAPRNSRRQYLLRSLIKCGFCGKTFCGSYSKGRPNKSKGTTYYKCTMKSRWKDMGVPKCPSPILRGDEIETVVWEDIKNFCKSPETVLAQLKAQQKPADEGMEDRINHVSTQIVELKRQEANLMRIAAASQEVDTQILDEQLLELHNGQEELVAYKATLEARILQSRTLEDDLSDIADRLAQLGDRIDQATFEEKRRAVEELVKRIEVQSVEMNGKTIPSVTITYRFNEPIQEIPPLPTSVIVNHTGVHVDTICPI